MLILAILAGIGSAFYHFAKNNHLKTVLWAILGPGSYFIAQFFAGIVVGLFAPDILYDDGALLILGLVSGFAGVGIAFLIMRSRAKAVENERKEASADILDDEFGDELDTM